MPETTDIDRQKVDPHLTARIVQSYVRHHSVETGQVSELITAVHRALGQVGQPAQPEEVRTPAVSARQSVRHDYVVCLDCGHRAKMLRRHIGTRHALSPDEYLKRWGLRRDHPLIAPSYSERRSSMARQLGLGRKSKSEVSSATTPAVPVADPKLKAKPARRGSTRSASKSEVASDAAAENTPTRSLRSRSKS